MEIPLITSHLQVVRFQKLAFVILGSSSHSAQFFETLEETLVRNCGDDLTLLGH